MKLEVGQFARLKSGYICKIININDFREPNMKYGVEANYLKDIMFIGDDDVVKASYSIIDILEVGDIISFYEDIDNYKKQYVIGIPDLITLDNIKDKITNDNIRLVSILTKEQIKKVYLEHHPRQTQVNEKKK